MKKPKKKSPYGKWRALSLGAVYLLIGIHIAHWKIAGKTLAPLEVSEVLHTLHLGIITAGFIFMVVAMLATAIVGRFFCSWGCHMLALQDLCVWLLGKIGIKPKAIRSRILIWIPSLTMAYLFIWPQIQRFVSGKELPALRVQSDSQGWASFVTDDFWRNLPDPWISLLTFAVCGFLIVYFLGSRSFCRYACPYGAIFGAVDRLAPGRITLSGDCQQCAQCTAVCQSGVRVHAEIKKYGMVVDSNCMKDLDCVSVCPQEAIQFGFRKPPLFSRIFKRMSSEGRYSFSLSEDIAMAGMFLIFLFILRGLYFTLPLLLSIGISVIFAYFSLLSVRLIRETGVRISRFNLKISGKLTKAGWVFTGIASVIALFSIHSGYIHYHSYAGQQIYDNLVKRENRVPGKKLTTVAAKASVRKALDHFEKAYNWGLGRPLILRREMASLYLMQGSPELAKFHVKEILAKNSQDLEARLLLGSLMLRLGKRDEAVRELRKVLVSDENLYSDHDYGLRAAAHAALAHVAMKKGNPSDAIQEYELALQDNPDDPDVLLALGALLAQNGRLDEAEITLQKSAELQPNSAVVHNNLAAVLTLQNRKAEAILHYRELLRILPNHAPALRKLSLLLYEQGQFEDALIHQKRAGN